MDKQLVRRHRCEGCEKIFICEICTELGRTALGTVRISRNCMHIFACGKDCLRKIKRLKRMRNWYL